MPWVTYTADGEIETVWSRRPRIGWPASRPPVEIPAGETVRARTHRVDPATRQLVKKEG